MAAMRPRGESCSSPVTRYVGQCGRHRPQRDARHQLVLVDGEEPGALVRGSVRASSRQPPATSRGSRPGDSLPSGSNAARTRTASLALGGGDAEAVEPGSAGFAEQPPAAGRSPPRAPPAERASSSAATCTVPTPTSASQRTPVRVERGAQRRAASTVAPRCARGARPSGQRGAPASVGGACDRACVRPPTSAATPSSSTWVRVPSHARHDGRNRRRRSREGIGVGREPLRRRRDRLAAQGDLHQHPDGAERADEEAREVEPAHVLHRRAAALDDAAVGGDEPHLEHTVAQRSVAGAAGGRTGRWRAARRWSTSGSRGSSAHSCPSAPSTAGQLAARGAGARR